MFSIYGINGMVFQGSMETMQRVHQARRIAAVRPIAEDGNEIGVEVDQTLAVQSGKSPQDEAIRTYRQMIHADLDRGPLYHAAQIMRQPVISVRADDAVADAWRLLRDRRIHQAPVLDASDALVGIVSERDLLTVIDLDGEKVIETLRRQVRQVMTSPVVAAATVTDIRRIASVMLDYGVAGVPVTSEQGRLAGFISRSDILRAVVTDPPLSLWR